MGDPASISKGDWEVILHAPFQVYSTVAGADGAPSEAQFGAWPRTLTGNLDRPLPERPIG